MFILLRCPCRGESWASETSGASTDGLSVPKGQCTTDEPPSHPQLTDHGTRIDLNIYAPGDADQTEDDADAGMGRLCYLDTLFIVPCVRKTVMQTTD